MPTIPLIQDSQQLQVGEGRQRVQSSPDAFGAQEARGLAQVGQGLGQVAQVSAEIDDNFNEARAYELDTELSRRIRDRLYNTESGYLSTQRGRNAIDGRAQVEADIDQELQTVGDFLDDFLRHRRFAPSKCACSKNLRVLRSAIWFTSCRLLPPTRT